MSDWTYLAPIVGENGAGKESFLLYTRVIEGKTFYKVSDGYNSWIVILGDYSYKGRKFNACVRTETKVWYFSI